MSLTNRQVALPLMSHRGPSFKLPASSGWAKLEEDYEPSAKELFDIVHDAYETNEKKQIVGMGENDTPVTFAGYGEPLLRLDTAAEATGLIREYRHGVKFRMETSGLLLQCDLTRSIQKILDARISEVSVFLPAADPVSYKKEMGGKLGDGYDFQGLCSFIASLAEAGVTVDCWAINKPGVDIPSLRQLALSLGAVDLLGLSYHP